MADANFDLAIVGAGPAGHVAAERAGRLGKRVLVVERSHLGGVCLNQGCIPTKTLLHSAKLFAHAQHGQSFGVSVEGARYDLAKAMAWKTQTVETLRKGIAFQFRKAGVELVQGTARLAGPRAIEVDGKTFGAERILLATGSSAATLPVPGADAPHVMGSTEALEIASLPKSIAIVGGGYIGMEFATYFARLGVKVAVVEMLPEIVPLLDAEIAVLLRRSLPDVEFHLGAKVLSYGADGVKFVQEGKEQVAAAERVLVAVGRRPIVEGLGLETVGVEFDRKGVKVDDRMRTNVPGIWAAGDVTGRSMLAHAASRMGEVAVADMFPARGRPRPPHALARDPLGRVHRPRGGRRGPLGGAGEGPGPGGEGREARSSGQRPVHRRERRRPGHVQGRGRRGLRPGARRADDRAVRLGDRPGRGRDDRGGAAGARRARDRVPPPHGERDRARRALGAR